jgi:enoyl-CoA hydratase/carnithine racemase
MDMSTTASSPLATGDGLHTYVENGIGFIELARPQALNALSIGMIGAMRAALDAWRDDRTVAAVLVRSLLPRAFCAGGDVRYFYETSKCGDIAARDRYFIEEYALDHAIFSYPKPYIALMHGVVMGGGMGIAQGAHRTGGLRVVTGSTQMAMPETRIGLFPDVGAGWFLARTPGAIGRYLAVTGVTIGAADALYAGLADVYLEDAAIPGLLQALTHESFVSGFDVVARIQRAGSGANEGGGAGAGDLGLSRLAATRVWIDRHFGQPSIAAILASLESEREEGARDWAEETIAVMRERSPMSMAVALEVVTRAEGAMADCLRRDLDLTRSMFEFGDVVEGVRARIIDKDNRPHWRLARIEDVTSAQVAAMFESPWPAQAHPLRDLQD